MDTIQKLESQIKQAESSIELLQSQIDLLRSQQDFLKALIVMVKEYNQLLKRNYVKI